MTLEISLIEHNLWYDPETEKWSRRRRRQYFSSDDAAATKTVTQDEDNLDFGEVDAPEANSASRSKTQSSSYGHLRDLPHDHDDWELDESRGLYFSKEAELYFDRDTGKFYDPQNKHWYDPETEKWSLDDTEL